MKRTADLPLHGGKAPPWLFRRMVGLARGITEVMILEYGHKGFLERISDPFWFQSLSCVLGFDWHSSGTTTVTTGALKEAIDPDAMGIAIAGGKGKVSLKTPDEIMNIGSRFGLSDTRLRNLQRISRLSAKVDNALVQDSFKLYHHSFFLSEKGDWCVIQQGMNTSYARRYHWFDTRELIEEPHKAIMGHRTSLPVLDLTSSSSRMNRGVELDLVLDGPDRLQRLYDEVTRLSQKSRDVTGLSQTTLEDWIGQSSPGPTGRSTGKTEGKDTNEEGWNDKIETALISEVSEDILTERLVMPTHINWDAIRDAYDFVPTNYEELISIKGIGPATVRSLALIGELMYGTEASWKDPIKYSFTVGGKDGVPYPVDRKAMDESIDILREGIDRAKVGDKERLKAIQSLRRFVPDDR